MNGNLLICCLCR